MLRFLIISFVTLLTMANLFLIHALNRDREKQTGSVKTATNLVTIISVCNILAAISGIVFW